MYLQGGSTGGFNDVPSGVVDIFNAQTDSWSKTTLKSARTAIGAASIAGYGLAIFAGGENATHVMDTIDIYNSATGKWSSGRLSQPRSHIAAVSLGTKAFFAVRLRFDVFVRLCGFVCVFVFFCVFLCVFVCVAWC